MNVISYVNRRKKQFTDRREAIMTAKHEDKQEALLRMREQRKKLEARVKTSEALATEQAKIKDLKQKQFAGSLAGKIVGNMKSKIREGRAQGNVFTQGSGGNNIFTQTEDPFKNLEKKRGKPKSIY